MDTNPDNLSVYHEGDDGEWTKVPSKVNKSDNTVEAEVSEPGIYTISADEPEDATNPEINLVEPLNLSGLSGNISFKVLATDNNAVKKVSFFVDSQLVFANVDPSDGWSAVISMNNYLAGNHKLKIEAEDYYGNIGTRDYDFSSTSSFLEPKVTIDSPKDGNAVSGVVIVSGQASSLSENTNHTISYFIDDVFLVEGELQLSGQFTKEMNFSQIKSGQHVLKATVTSENGREYFSVVEIFVNEKAQIMSPENKAYGHSETVPIIYSTNFEGAVVKIDGKAVLDSSKIKLPEMPLGNHIISIQKENRIIASTQFLVKTSCVDLSVMIKQLYGDKKISSTVYFGVIGMITNATAFESSNDVRTRNAYLKMAVSYITSMSMRGTITKIYAGLIINDSTAIINSGT